MNCRLEPTLALLALSAGLIVPSPGAARGCDDAAAIASVRGRAADLCDCTDSPSHREAEALAMIAGAGKRHRDKYVEALRRSDVEATSHFCPSLPQSSSATDSTTRSSSRAGTTPPGSTCKESFRS